MFYYDLPADLRSEFSRFLREGSIKRSQQRVSSHFARCGLQTRLMELHWHTQLTSYFSPLGWAVCIIVIFALRPEDAHNFVINVVRPLSLLPLFLDELNLLLYRSHTH